MSSADSDLKIELTAVDRVTGPLRLAEAVLLLHSPSPWDIEKRERWTELTGVTECTTKTLCDFARKVLGGAS